MNAVVIRGDARHLPLPDESVDLIVTSPPYFGLRSYTDDGEHYDGQIGSEATPQEWVAALVDCTREWMRVLKPSGSLFVNLGDKYNSAASNQQSGDLLLATRGAPRAAAQERATGGRSRALRDMPTKSLMGLPWRYAIACTDQLGLTLRRDIIWNKPNGLPESVTDRCRTSHEYLFHLVKQPRYYAAVDEIREPQLDPMRANRRPERMGRNGSAGDSMPDWGHATREYNPLGKLPGSVWTIPSQPLTVPPHLGIDHFAAYPMELPRRCILGWSPPGICTTCGEGRRPVTDKRLADVSISTRSKLAKQGGRTRINDGIAAVGVPLSMGRTEATITGYACACPDTSAPTRPSVVVDPFGGTGTTALVAAAYGRMGITIDRSADYCRLATWRTTDPAERAKALQVPKPPPIPDGQESLFDDMEAI